MKHVVLAAVAVFLAGPAGHAKAELIVNGSFEDPVLAPGAFALFTPGQTLGGAWAVLGNPGTNIALSQTLYGEPFNNTSRFNAQDGFNSIDLTGSFNQGPSAGVEQTVATISGQQYTLSFYVG